jgi:hypothetical protein
MRFFASLRSSLDSLPVRILVLLYAVLGDRLTLKLGWPCCSDASAFA